MMPAQSSGAASGVGEHLRDRVGVPLVYDCVLAVTTVGVPAGERGSSTEVLVTSGAEPARAARRAQPRDPDTLAPREAPGVAALGGHVADDLVSRHDARTPRGEIALHEVKVRAADTTDVHLHEDLVRARLGDRTLDEAQRALGGRGRVIKRPGPHAAADPFRLAAAPAAGSRAEATISATSVTRCTVRPSRTFAGTSSRSGPLRAGRKISVSPAR